MPRSHYSHNIDADKIMGMFSAGKEKAKNANDDFLAARMRSIKTRLFHGLMTFINKKGKA